MDSIIPNFLGIKIIQSDLCMERRQNRFPRTKKKRIRNKWAKQEKNFVYNPTAYYIGNDSLICHPSFYYKLTLI